MKALKPILALVALLSMPLQARANDCTQAVVPYATASTIPFCLKKYDSTNADDNEKVGLKTDATFSAGDVKINLNAAGTWAGETNIATLPTDRGNCYSIPLSTGETTGLEGYITIVDQDSTQVWVAACIRFFTSGNAAAFYPTLDANVISLAGVTQSLTDLKDFADDGYDPSTNKIQGLTLVDDITTKTGYRLSATGVDDIWDEPLAGHTTSGTSGKTLTDGASGSSIRRE